MVKNLNGIVCGKIIQAHSEKSKVFPLKHKGLKILIKFFIFARNYCP